MDEPKENMPPGAGAGAGAWAWVGFPPVLPEKGLLKPLAEVAGPPDPKLKLKLPPLLSPDPDWVFNGAAPKRGAEVGAGAGAAAEFIELPNKLGPELAPAVPKLNRGGVAVVSVPRPLNCFLAGDAASCFIGLPANKPEVEAGGDFGAPNRDLAAA